VNIYSIEYIPKNDIAITQKEYIAARNENEAITQIIHLGTPVECKEVDENTFIKVPNDYKKLFLTAIFFNVESGMSSGKALGAVIRGENGKIRRQLNPALQLLDSGGDFSDAIESLGMYDKAILAILRSGEKIGAMKQALKSAIDQYDQTFASKKLLYGALFGLSIDLLFSIISTYAIQFQFLPMVEKQGISGTDPEVIASFHRNLSIAYGLNTVLTVITTLVLIVILWLVYTYNQKSNIQLRLKVDHFLSTSPYIKHVFAHTAISQTFAMCATLLNGGISFVNAIGIIKGISASPIIEEYWIKVEKSLLSGDLVINAMMSPILTPSEVLIISSHKDSAQLATSLKNISVQRNEMAIQANKRFGMSAFIAAMAYSGVSVLIALFASYLQYSSMMSSMTSS